MTTSISIYHRFIQLLLGWGTVGVCYTLSQLTPRTSTLLHESRWDAAVVFNPNAVVWYLSFFAFIPLAYLCIRAELLPTLRRAMQLSGLMCAAVFISYPTHLATQPSLNMSGWSTWLLQFVREFDTGQNCLPSLHAALTLIAVWAICQGSISWQLPRRIVALVWAGLIVYSIVEVRRHLWIDVSAGLAVGIAALYVSEKLS